jgi:probable rRNA maturation factor
LISVQQRASVRGRVHPSTIRRRAARLLAAVEAPGAELSIVLTDDAEIRALNAAWRHKDKATDVLSFPQDIPGLPPGAPRSLGDVVISLETAERQRQSGALERLWPELGGRPKEWSLLDEVSFLLLHGVLHLLGYDHHEDAEAEEMEAIEAQLLPRLIRPRSA